MKTVNAVEWSSPIIDSATRTKCLMGFSTNHVTNDPEACLPLHSSCKATGYGLQRTRYYHLGGRLCKSVACPHSGRNLLLLHVDATPPTLPPPKKNLSMMWSWWWQEGRVLLFDPIVIEVSDFHIRSHYANCRTINKSIMGVCSGKESIPMKA